MNNQLNVERLARLVKAKRGVRGLREVSQEIGDVSPSTLSRLENGSVPDMHTFLALCDWLQISASELLEVEGAQNKSSILESVAVQIRSDKTLDEVTALALVEVIRAVYRGSQR